MKCISCGAEIGLTEEKCPYCGRAIKETARHRADLKAYKKRNEIAKRGLAKVISENMPMVISAVVMIVLIIALIVVAYIENNVYTFRSGAMRKESVERYEEFSAEMEAYLEAGDYTGFVAFKEYHNIAEWEEPYKELKLLCERAEEYDSLVSGVESVVMFGEDARWYDPESEISDCQRVIWRFYYEYGLHYEEIEKDPYAEYIHDMKNKADILLKIYLGLDDEGLEEFLKSSEIHQLAYLEEVLMHD